MKFTLEIDLGNDAMRTSKDVARSLRVLALGFTQDFMEAEMKPGNQGAAMDMNGNRVGGWRVEP